MMSCADVDDLLAGLALGSASTDERREVEAHLASCRQHPQLGDFERIADMLPMSLDPVAPREQVKRKLMARVYQDLEPELVRQPLWRRTWGWATAAVLAVLALGLGVRDYAVSSRLASAPVQWQLQPVQAGTRANGTLVWLPSQRTATLTLRGLPALAPNQVYEVWLIKDGQPAPAGVFQPAGSDSAAVLVQGDLLRFDTVAVTAEPGPQGSQAPTTQPFVAGALH